MGEENEDPIYDIRCAVAKTLRAMKVPGDHKHITDRVVDELPAFFRNSLAVIENTASADDELE